MGLKEKIRSKVEAFRGPQDREWSAGSLDNDRERPPELGWREGLGFVWRYLIRHPWAVTGIVVLGLINASMEFVSISLILPFIESIGGGGAGTSPASQTAVGFLTPFFEGLSIVDQIRVIAVGLVAIQLVKGVLKYGMGRIASYLYIMVDRDLRTTIFDQLLAVDLSFVHREQVANLYTIMHKYPPKVAKISNEFSKAVPKVSSFLGYAAVMVTLSWELSIVAIVLAILTTRVITLLSGWVRNVSHEINTGNVKLSHVSLEALNAMKTIHLFGREEHAQKDYEGTLSRLQWDKYKAGSIQSAVSPTYGVLNMAMIASILLAATFILDSSITGWVVLLTTFLMVSMRLLNPASSFAKKHTRISKYFPALEEVKAFLDRDDKPFMPNGDEPFDGFDDAVRFEDVSFRYGPDLPDVLKSISFEIPQGDMVAMVGASGAGKSTAVNLLARLYDPTDGRVAIDGTDLRDFDVTTWRRSLAVVSQDTFLFNDTVEENIRFGRLDATDEEIKEAAQLANAHAFIEELEDGYQTVIGDRGVRLSGGQAQRIAIARAILADPEILILDEATSALDTATERQVQEAIERVSEDRTVFAIAHRLSTIKDADNIIVLEGGEIVEEGAHEELLAAEGQYWEYVHMQALLEDGPEGTNGDKQAPQQPIERPADT